MFDWDDLQVFLAVYRERTTGRAANALGRSQPTIVRRIAALEQALELPLFERSPIGLTPTPAADRLAPIAEKAERAICAFGTEAGALAGTGQNEIRLTFLDHFERLLIPVLRQFRSRWPAVHAQLLASDKIYNLERGEADIAIRGRDRPASDELVVHQLPPTGWTVYASADLRPEERPTSAEEVGDFAIALLGSSAGRLPIYSWLEELASGAHPIRCSNYSALKSAIASGAAVSVLPCTVGDNDPELVACFPPLEQFDVDIFLIARRAILRRPPARDLFDSIAAHFRDNPQLLMGRRG